MLSEVNTSSWKPKRCDISSAHLPTKAFGQMIHTFSNPCAALDSSSAQIRPASIVFPVPTSSAIRRRWSGDSSIFLTGRNWWYISLVFEARYDRNWSVTGCSSLRPVNATLNRSGDISVRATAGSNSPMGISLAEPSMNTLALSPIILITQPEMDGSAL